MRREAKRLGILLMLTYMVSYLTRINYGAVLVEMVAETGFSKPELSAAVTGAFITYGAGQVISGFWGDQIQPRKMVFVGFVGTTLINTLLPLCSSPWMMTALWCVNGFAQAFMWPPMVRLMTGLLTDEEYAKTTVIVSWGSSGGTILLYLLSPILVAAAGWRSVFWFSALCGLVILPVWWKLCPELTLEKREQRKQSTSYSVSVAKLMLSPMMLATLLCIVIQGALRDSVTTWMPTYVSEMYHVGSEISILTGVILPVFSILSFRVAQQIYEKKLPNAVACAAALFAGGTAAGILLLLCSGHSAFVSVFSLACLTGCMHGVNLMLVCILPSRFKWTGKVSLISGLMNACTYLGSALSTYGVAVLTQSAGWGGTIRIWVGLALLGMLLCLVGRYCQTKKELSGNF
ncbi:MAG: MFS transporter [Oscillospiraceae bacterium]|nr:MFS transporter [Oscillospiraceae bacterium]